MVRQAAAVRPKSTRHAASTSGRRSGPAAGRARRRRALSAGHRNQSGGGLWRPIDRALELLDRFDWLVFSSSNGVRYFLDRLPSDRPRPARCSARVKIAAIGPGTAEELGQVSPEGRPHSRRIPGRVAGPVACRQARGQAIPAGPRQPRARSPGRGTDEGRRTSSSRSWSMKASTWQQADPEIAAQMAAGQSTGPPSPAPPSPARSRRLFGESLQQHEARQHQPHHLRHASRAGLRARR